MSGEVEYLTHDDIMPAFLKFIEKTNKRLEELEAKLSQHNTMLSEDANADTKRAVLLAKSLGPNGLMSRRQAQVVLSGLHHVPTLRAMKKCGELYEDIECGKSEKGKWTLRRFV
jgi:Mg2+ and Co2+ transporter CorA